MIELYWFDRSWLNSWLVGGHTLAASWPSSTPITWNPSSRDHWMDPSGKTIFLFFSLLNCPETVERLIWFYVCINLFVSCVLGSAFMTGKLHWTKRPELKHPFPLTTHTCYLYVIPFQNSGLIIGSYTNQKGCWSAPSRLTAHSFGLMTQVIQWKHTHSEKRINTNS